MMQTIYGTSYQLSNGLGELCGFGWMNTKMTYYDQEFKIEMNLMLERFLENNLGVVDGKIIGIPFVCQNISHLFLR